MSSQRAAITVGRPRAEVERLWRSGEHRPGHVGEDADVRFVDAPGDRGTEIHVDLGSDAGGLGGLVRKLTGDETPVGKVKEDLRRFKQSVETGEVPRSDGTPEGQQPEQMFKQRPAQPLSEDELQKVGG
jgi:uncharacterized membrane protein